MRNKIATSTSFDDKDTLRDIRLNSLNPLLSKVENSIVPSLSQAKKDILLSYNDAHLDEVNRALVLVKHDGDKVTIPLDSILPPDFKGISISNDTTTVHEILNLILEDVHLSKTGNTATMSFDWDNLIPTHQKPFYGALDTDPQQVIEKIVIKDKTKASIEHKVLTIDIPDSASGIVAHVIDGTTTPDKPIHKISVEGNTTGSEVTAGGVLKINIPTPSTSVDGANFQGFFETEGDLISNVANPVNSKSYAFVKDQKLKGQYYTPYFFVGNTWTEAPIEPSMTYESVGGTEIKGVFSIKPNAKIQIDVNGQLNLDGLQDGHFQGFFNSLALLQQYCPRPVVDRTCGYVYNNVTDVYAFYKYTRMSSGNQEWQRILPYGMVSAVTKNSGGDITSAKPIYGIEENPMVSVTGGVATIKDITTQRIKIKAKDGEDHVEKEADVKGLHFIDGIYVDLTREPDWAIITHPQRVIEYNDAWENKHNSSVFLGNIFFDKTSDSWIGYTGKTTDTDRNNWTKISHRHMSDEVKSLTRRFPARSEGIDPGTLGDNGQWFHTGWTYVEDASDVGLKPEDLYKSYGIHIMTFVRKGPGDGDIIPKYRMQVGFIEDMQNGFSEIWTRFADINATDSEPVWKDWIKSAASMKDLVNHNNDPKAHIDMDPFYKVYTFDHTYDYLKTCLYYLREHDLMLTASSTGAGIGLSNETVLVPYTGTYNLSGKISIDQLFNTAGGVPLKNWKFQVTRQRQGQADETYNFFHSNKQSNAEVTVSMKWNLPNVAFQRGDSLVFNFRCINDGDFVTTYPNTKMIPMRSYIVLEDSKTSAGTRIAETFRRTLGILNQRGDVGVNVHRREYQTTGGVRVYGRAINSNYENMTHT